MEQQERFEKVAAFLQGWLKERDEKEIQIFNCRSWTADAKAKIYSEDGVDVLYAYYWDYIEVLGLTDEEFERFVVDWLNVWKGEIKA